MSLTWPTLLGTDMSDHLDALYWHARRYGDVVELGTRAGVSTTALLEGAEHVTSVDLEPCEQAHANLTALGLAERWEFRQGDARVMRLPLGPFWFVDAGHAYEETRTELARARDLGAVCILMHDVLEEDMKRAIESFMGGDPRWAYAERTFCYGLGHLWLPEARCAGEWTPGAAP